MSLLVLSRLPDFITLYYSKYRNRALILILSSSLSAIWHYYEEPYGSLMYLDYCFAIAWFIYELAIYKPKSKILLMNLIIFAINICILFSPRGAYTLYHNIWYLLSASKSIYAVMKYNPTTQTKHYKYPLLPV